MNWQTALQYFLHYVFPVVAPIGVLAAALPTKIGDRIIGGYFDQRFAAYKGKLDRELEQLKTQLAHLEDRSKHSNEAEYKALAEIWEKFVDTQISSHACVMMLVRYPDLTLMGEEDIRGYLSSTGFSERQKEEVLESGDRNRAFSRVMQFRYIRQAEQDIFEARQLIRKRGIFVPKAMKEAFESALDIFSNAQIEREMGFEHGERILEGMTSIKTYLSEYQGIFNKLQDSTRTRLLQELELKD